MTGLLLARAYLQKCEVRLIVLRVFLEHEAWSDVVREAQECAELPFKAMLRAVDADVPKVHEVGPSLTANAGRFPADIDVPKLAAISLALRKDRELAM